MGKGGFPGFGGNFGGNLGNLMKQAQKAQEQIQKDIEKLDQELKEKQFEANSGGGAVTVIVNGECQILNINLKPEIVDPEDIETLQDTIIASANEAIKKAKDFKEAEMAKISGGLPNFL